MKTDLYGYMFFLALIMFMLTLFLNRIFFSVRENPFKNW